MREVLKQFVIKILTLEAAILLKRHNPKIVAITGSVGKTSTKDATYAAVKNSSYARKSEKSFNSEIGVPLTILGLPNAWNNPLKWLHNIVEGFLNAFFSRSYPEVLIIEAGIDRKGDMERLTKWLKPDIVVLTRLPEVPVHVEHFDTPELVIEEKMKLVSALKSDGVLIYNNDDTIIKSQLHTVRQKQVGFGRYLDTDFTARNDKVVYKDGEPVGVEFSLLHMQAEHKVSINNTVGTQHMYSCLAALAVADELSVPTGSAVESIQSLVTPPGRMRVVAGLKDSVLIDDSYNSSPIAAEQALQALNELVGAKRKIAVLGDMLELGKFSSDEHRRIGGLAKESADILITVGVRSKQMADGALAAGMSEKNIFQYEEAKRAGRELQSMLNPGDYVLIKGSQGVRMEKIILEVMAEPQNAESVLVRQDQEWKNR